MKTKIFLIAGVVCIFITGCALLDKLTQFTIAYSHTLTLPAGIPAHVSTEVVSPYFPTNSSAYFGQNGTNADLIESCKLKEMKGVLVDSPGEDFSFIQTIQLFLFSKTQAETEIAYKNNVDENTGDTLFFDLRDVELVNYIKQDSIGLKVRITTARETEQEIHTRLDLSFLVNAKILGI